MGNRAIIGLDLDGVVADFHEIAVNILNEMYGTTFTIKDWTSWRFVGNYLWRSPNSPFKSEVDGRKAEKEIFELAWDKWYEIPPQEPNAIQYANELTKYGKVILLTIRQGFPDAINVALWCAQKGLKIDGFFALGIDSGLKKSDFFPPFNVIIDDSPTFVEQVIKVSNARIYLRDQPWNQDIFESNQLKRIYSLKEVISDLKELGYGEA